MRRDDHARTQLANEPIDWIDFPVGAEPGTIDAETLIKLGLIDGPVAVIPGIFAVFFCMQYHLSRERHDEIQAELERRHAANNPA